MTAELTWLKSSYSQAQTECLEIAPHPGTLHVRDSKLAPGPQLAFPTLTWSSFIAHISITSNRRWR